MLTDEQIERHAEAYKAWTRGETVEYQAHEGEWRQWGKMCDTFTFSKNDILRIKPTTKPPEYVPFTRDTIPMPCVIVWHGQLDNKRCVLSTTEKGVYAINSAGLNEYRSYPDLLANFTMDDGSPAGTLKP